MKRQPLLQLTAFALVLVITATAWALPAKTQWLASQGIISGRHTGQGIDYALNSPLRRDEATKLLVNYTGEGGRARARQLASPPFTDIAVTNWAAGYADVAKHLGLLTGYPDGSFQPGNSVTYAEFSSMLVRLDRRWKAAVPPNIIWPDTYLERAAQYGILNDISFANANSPVLREDAFAMLYNAIHAQQYVIYLTFDDQNPLSPQQQTYELNLGSALGSRFPLNPTVSQTEEEFVGWNTAFDGSGNWVNRDTTFNSSQTIYGIWQTHGIAIQYVERLDPITLGRSDTITADEVGLPTYITLYLSDHRPMTIPITWDRTSLDPRTPGRYVLPGSYTVPASVTGGPAPAAELVIHVK